MAPVLNKLSKWNPTAEQRKVFEKWRKETIGYLVGCKKGIEPYKLPKMMEEVLGPGKRPPVGEMGLPVWNINHFLYQMREDLELHRVKERDTRTGATRFKFTVSIKESALPEHLIHLREMVLEQRATEFDRRLKGATVVPFEELLGIGIKRPSFQTGVGPSQSFGSRRSEDSSTMANKVVGNLVGNRNGVFAKCSKEPRKITLSGIVDDDGDSDLSDDFDGLDVYYGQDIKPAKKQNHASPPEPASLPAKTLELGKKVPVTVSVNLQLGKTSPPPTNVTPTTTKTALAEPAPHRIIQQHPLTEFKSNISNTGGKMDSASHVGFSRNLVLHYPTCRSSLDAQFLVKVLEFKPLIDFPPSLTVKDDNFKAYLQARGKLEKFLT